MLGMVLLYDIKARVYDIKSCFGLLVQIHHDNMRVSRS